LREELVAGIHDANVLDRPIVFLVATNIPHTGIYILHGGQFYSVAYGYDTTPATGSLYSIDIPLIQFSEARIVWIGMLNEAIVGRLQAEFDRVTHIFGNFKPADVAGQPLIVDRLMFFHTPRVYGGGWSRFQSRRMELHQMGDARFIRGENACKFSRVGEQDKSRTDTRRPDTLANCIRR
jgi:hypothetical protein